MTALSLTSLRSTKRGALASPASNPTLAQSVYSIGTSKVTNDSKERSDDNEDDIEGVTKSQLGAIDGMDIVLSRAMMGKVRCYLRRHQWRRRAHTPARRG